MIKNPYNIFARYYETTSDLFFADAQAQTFDVIFVDGLHTYAQALHDATNALNHLSRKGVLVMHDCSPPHNAAAFPAASAEEAVSANVPGWTGEWCGDVWKAICHLRSQRTDLQIFVLDCDYGVGVVRFGVPEAQLVLTTEGIDTMTYVDLERDRERLLNLKPENYLSDFLGS